MPQQATLDAEIADLKVRLAFELDPNVRAMAQDRVNSIQVQKMAAPVYGMAEHERTKGRK